MADDHHHHHHGDHQDPNSFLNSPGSAAFGFLAAFFAYWLSLFAYVENDIAALAKASARGETVVWTTFDKHLQQTPLSFIQPSNHEELLSIIKGAREKNQTIKVVGSGHSWSPLGLSDGIMLNLDKLDKIIEIDTEHKTVTTQAGIRIRDLSAALAKKGLSLENTGILNRQSLAGALATGTHGTGLKFPIMSAHILAMEIVTSQGEVIKVRKNDPDPFKHDVFEAATVSLGALGVITKMKIQLIDSFSVFKRNQLMHLRYVLDDIEGIAQRNDHLLVWWVPYTNTAQLLTSNRTVRGQSPPSTESLLRLNTVKDYLIRPLRPLFGVTQLRLMSAAGWFTSLLPLHTVPFMNKVLVAPFVHMLAGGTLFVEEGYEGICLDDHPDQYREQEYFIPRSNFSQAFAEFQDFLEANKETLGSNFVVQLRVTRQDDLWLSPFRGSEPWYVSVAQLIKGFDCEAYFRGAETIWRKYGGKPHWGKLHNSQYNELSEMYGEAFEKFLNVRRQLDPTDTFLNTYLTDLFIPRAIR